MVEFNKELKVKARSEGQHLEQSDVVWDFTAVVMMLMMGGDWWLNGYLSCHSHQWILEIGSLPFSSTKQNWSCNTFFHILVNNLLKIFKCSTDMIRLFGSYYLSTSSISNGAILFAESLLTSESHWLSLLSSPLNIEFMTLLT